MYTHGERRRLGALLGETLAELDEADLPTTLDELISAGPQVWERAGQFLKTGQCRHVSAESLHLLAPLARPGKVIGIGLNYMDHCREQNVPVPSSPLVFAKFTTAVTGPGEPISWDPELTQQVDFEAELGVVIGRRARNVPKEEALSYVFGYTALNDVSARDLQFSDRQWVRAKSLDSFCPIGPLVVSADEIPNPQALAIRCRLNGELMQDSCTSEMIFGVAELIAFLSRAFTLEPGDLIATGTPNGVGVFRDPKVFLKDGDRVEVEIEKIGVLSNPVRLK